MTTWARDRRRAFAELHEGDLFVMPNPWDVGSARLLESLGFAALATTSSGHAASLGLRDQQVRRAALLVHATALAGAVRVPLNVDAERGFGDDPEAVGQTVAMLAQTGAAGCSIEDYDPGRDAIDPVDVAVARVAAAAQAAHAAGLVLTARAENHLYGAGTLDDTIARLRAYRDAGADVVYAPGLSRLSDIERVVASVSAPVNVLALPGGPTVSELASVGVRRVSTGGALAWAAYGALREAATELRDAGTSTYAARSLTPDQRRDLFRG